MNASEYLTNVERLVPCLREMGRTGALSYRTVGEFTEFVYDKAKMTTYRKEAVELIEDNGLEMAAGVDLFIHAEVLAKGLKVFRPTLAQCLDLEQIEVRLGINDYAQPFPTFVVEFPEEYKRLRRLTGICGRGMEYTYEPIAQAMHFRPGSSTALACCFTSGIEALNAVSRGGRWLHATLCGSFGGDDIEADMNKKMPDSVSVLPEEWVAIRRFMRVGANACLLLTNLGCKATEANSAKLAKLRHDIEASKRRRGNPEVIAKKEQQARLTPLVYGFAQEIKLRECVQREAIDADLPSGRVVAPHWRRAHWRMAPCGPKGLNRRRVLIPALMVNKSRFAGDLSATKVAYSK